MPRFSIVIPCHNAETFVEATIRSCLAQSVEDIEVIVVNDGSTDRSSAIVGQFTADPRVRLMSQPNRGVGAARNLGLKAARGEYVNFVDADDLLETQKLERQGAVLDANVDIGIVLCDGWVIDGAGKKIRDYLIQASRLAGPAPLFAALFASGLFPPVVPLVRRKLALDVGGFSCEREAAGWADTGFWLRVALSGSAYHFLGERLCQYREYAGSMSGRPDAMEEAALAVYASLMSERPRECAQALRSLHRKLGDAEGALLAWRTSWEAERVQLQGERQWYREQLELARVRGLRTWLAQLVAAPRSTAARPIYLWGAGSGGRRVLALIKSLGGRVSRMIDADPAKSGTTIEDVPVSHPDALPGFAGELGFVIICSTYVDSIRRQLHAMGRTEHADYAVVDFDDVTQLEHALRAKGNASVGRA